MRLVGIDELSDPGRRRVVHDGRTPDRLRILGGLCR
jgi:hypothetical protein